MTSTAPARAECGIPPHLNLGTPWLRKGPNGVGLPYHAWAESSHCHAFKQHCGVKAGSIKMEDRQINITRLNAQPDITLSGKLYSSSIILNGIQPAITPSRYDTDTRIRRDSREGL